DDARHGRVRLPGGNGKPTGVARHPDRYPDVQAARRGGTRIAGRADAGHHRKRCGRSRQRVAAGGRAGEPRGERSRRGLNERVKEAEMAKILIVEDNEMNRDMLSRRLARRGYAVVTAVDG